MNRSDTSAGVPSLAAKTKKSEINASIVSASKIVPDIAQVMSIIFSFGVVFPPLAVFGLIAMFSKIYSLQFMLRKFIKQVELSGQMDKFRLQLRKESYIFVIAMYRSLVWIFPVSSVVHALFLFDIAGGAYAGQQEQYAAIIPSVYLLVSWISQILIWRLQNRIVRDIRLLHGGISMSDENNA